MEPEVDRNASEKEQRMQDTTMIPRQQILEERPVSRQRCINLEDRDMPKEYQNDALKKRVEVA